ncbi:MAG: hypothetical protein H6633_06540 [Anaerolineales bacterium]|nr:hypothetical protein [Anaerolineales bacterium]
MQHLNEIHKKNKEKTSYRSPNFVQYGSLAELTKGNQGTGSEAHGTREPNNPTPTPRSSGG